MISEVDIKDWDRTQFKCIPKPTELYSMPRDTFVSFLPEDTEVYLFKKIDGMYSLCYDMTAGLPVHFPAWTKMCSWVKQE